MALALRVGPGDMLPALVAQPLWILALGPFFAALTGVGFKEFFCFQRPEAIGVTLLLPLALLGRLGGLFSPMLTGQLLTPEGLLLLVPDLAQIPHAGGR